MSFLFYHTVARQHQLDEEKRKRQRVDRRARRNRTKVRERMDELEDNMGYLSLVLGVLLQKVDEKGLVTREEVEASLIAIDEYDGKKDGKLDVNTLRRAIGDPTAEEEAAE